MTTPFRHSDLSGGKTALGERAYALVDVAMREAGDKPRAIVRLRQLAGEWFQHGNVNDAYALVENLIRWGENNDVPREAIGALRNDLSAIESHKASAAYADDSSAGQPEEKPEQRREQEKNDGGQKAHSSPVRFNVGNLFLPIMSAVAGFVLALVLSGFDIDSPVQESPAVAEVPVQTDKRAPAESAADDNPPAIDNPPLREKPVIKPKLPETKRKMHVSASGGVNIRATATATSDIVAKVGRFADVIAIGKPRDDWQKVQIGDKAGYIRGDLLGEGEGEIARCESDIGRPANGEVFVQRGRGNSSIKVDAANRDAYAKLKDSGGRTVLSFYIRANQSAAIKNLIGGSYFFQFTTGNRFSVVCKKFMQDGKYGLDPELTKYGGWDYQLEKTPLGNLQMSPISAEDFLRD